MSKHLYPYSFANSRGVSSEGSLMLCHSDIHLPLYGTFQMFLRHTSSHTSKEGGRLELTLRNLDSDLCLHFGYVFLR